MKESRIMPIPEFFWSGMAMFASSTMESVGGADNFFHDRHFYHRYRLLLRPHKKEARRKNHGNQAIKKLSHQDSNLE